MAVRASSSDMPTIGGTCTCSGACSINRGSMMAAATTNATIRAPRPHSQAARRRSWSGSWYSPFVAPSDAPVNAFIDVLVWVSTTGIGG